MVSDAVFVYEAELRDVEGKERLPPSLLCLLSLHHFHICININA